MTEDTNNNDNNIQWHKIYLGLGSNLGQRRANLVEAISRLKAGGAIRVKAVSRLYQTKPVGYIAQPLFLNLVVEAETSFEPLPLLDYVKQIEVKLGRQPTFLNGPRPIDLDILFYDELHLEEANIIIPHPRLAERGFVLAPLADLNPQLRHPLLNLSIETLLKTLNGPNRDLPEGVTIYTDEPPLDLPRPRLLFVTGRLAALWLENFLLEVSQKLDFEAVIAAMEIEVAAFMSARYIVSQQAQLELGADGWTKFDALILPGHTSGDIKQVETALLIRSMRGPNDLLEIEPFLAHLLNNIRPLNNFNPAERYYSEEDLRQMQARVTDANIRIYTDSSKVYAFNQHVFASATPDERDLRRLYRQLNINDPTHAYYLGRELYKAALAIKWGLRYHQDRELER